MSLWLIICNLDARCAQIKAIRQLLSDKYFLTNIIRQILSDKYNEEGCLWLIFSNLIARRAQIKAIRQSAIIALC